jgi:hypothetical protein
MRYLLGLFLALGITAAQAADNAMILTPGVGVTERSKDVGGGIQSVVVILGDSSGNVLATVPGTPNAVFALPFQGVTGGTPAPVSGTVTANAGTNLNTSLLALETGGNLASVLAKDTLTAAALGVPNSAASCAPSSTTTMLPCLFQIDADIKGAVPALNETAWNTIAPYTTGTVDATTANLYGNLYVDLGKNNGTAGTASTSVLTVQGIASGTLLGVGLNITPSLANGNGIVQTQGGNVLSATNGAYSNTLQGNAVLSATNGIFAALTDNTNGPAAVKAASTPSPATDKSLSVTINAGSNGIITLGPNTIGNSLPFTFTSQYPTNSVTTSPTPITANSTGSTGAVVGTMAATASVTNFLCGFDVSAVGGTAAVGPITVAGLIGSSMVFQLTSTAGGVTLPVIFNPCIPASAANTAITVTTTADGTATAVDVNAWGYRL